MRPRELWTGRPLHPALAPAELEEAGAVVGRVLLLELLEVRRQAPLEPEPSPPPSLVVSPAARVEVLAPLARPAEVLDDLGDARGQHPGEEGPGSHAARDGSGAPAAPVLLDHRLGRCKGEKISLHQG